MPPHLPKHLPGISRQLQTTPHITQNTKAVKINGFSSNLHYCKCLIFLCSCCFWARTRRLLQLVYVIEGITLFSSADHRIILSLGFFFLHRYSEHPESIEEGWQARASKQLCISYFSWNPGPSMSKEQTEKYFSQVEKD